MKIVIGRQRLENKNHFYHTSIELNFYEREVLSMTIEIINPVVVIAIGAVILSVIREKKKK